MAEEKFHKVRVLRPAYLNKKRFEPGEVFTASESEIEKFKQNLKGMASDKPAEHIGEQSRDQMLFELLPDETPPAKS